MCANHCIKLYQKPFFTTNWYSNKDSNFAKLLKNPKTPTHERQDKTVELIKAIQKAPPLEKLRVTNAADLEDLHARATKLKHLQFANVDIYFYGRLQSQAVYRPAESIELFSVQVGNRLDWKFLLDNLPTHLFYL